MNRGCPLPNRMSQHGLLCWLFSRRRNEHIWLGIGFADTVAGYVEVTLINLDTDELPVIFSARNARRAATHEGVQNSVASVAGTV